VGGDALHPRGGPRPLLLRHRRGPGDAPLAAVQPARAAHVAVQRSAVVLTQEAIRVCGSRALLKRHPLERYARDARAGALMRPWTQDIATQQAWECALGVGPP
jgi:alkylation response protein AidB-like acyl-CoA dehydrogenase